MVEPPYPEIDDGIRDAVRLVFESGDQTLESCEGGPGHGYRYPTIFFRAPPKGNQYVLRVLREQGYEIHSCRLKQGGRKPAATTGSHWRLRLWPSPRPRFVRVLIDRFILWTEDRI